MARFIVPVLFIAVLAFGGWYMYSEGMLDDLMGGPAGTENAGTSESVEKEPTLDEKLSGLDLSGSSGLQKAREMVMEDIERKKMEEEDRLDREDEATKKKYQLEKSVDSWLAR